MRNVLLALGAIIISVAAMAQVTRGKAVLLVNNEAGAPLEGITVELRRVADSVLVKTALTDNKGIADFDNLSFGNYFVLASPVSYSRHASAPFHISAEQPEVNLGSIKLVAQARELGGVTVSARKPFIQRLNDRLVVNVESSIVGAGSSAMDVLELSPGVTVDQNDIISLRGRSGVIIMIDGKPTPMTGADLANYLRGLPANAIERIDLITNPSAKYDAAGNSGIIDIRMKKDQRQGMNGTLNAGYGQGIYPKANSGGTFNYRKKSWNLFGNYNYAYRKNLNHLIINRNFFDNGVFRGSDDKDNYAVMPVNSHNFRAGADFYPSSKTILGVVVNSSFSRFRRRADINTTVNDLNADPFFRFLSIGTNRDRNSNMVANLNLKHRFDSTGRELTADVDY